MIEDNEIQERGTLAAFQIDKDTKRVESLADYHLYDNGQRVYTPANKPSAADVGAVAVGEFGVGARQGSAAIATDYTEDKTADFNKLITAGEFTVSGDWANGINNVPTAQPHTCTCKVEVRNFGAGPSYVQTATFVTGESINRITRHGVGTYPNITWSKWKRGGQYESHLEYRMTIDRAGDTAYPYMTLNKRTKRTDATGNYVVGTLVSKLGESTHATDPVGAGTESVGSIQFEVDKTNNYGTVLIRARSISGNSDQAWLKVYQDGVAFRHAGKELRFKDGGLTTDGPMALNGKLNNNAFTTSNKQILNANASDYVYVGNPTVKKILLETDANGDVSVNANGKANRVYHQGYKPTAADVGALPIGGGVLTGNTFIDRGDSQPFLGIRRAGRETRMYDSGENTGLYSVMPNLSDAVMISRNVASGDIKVGSDAFNVDVRGKGGSFTFKGHDVLHAGRGFGAGAKLATALKAVDYTENKDRDFNQLITGGTFTVDGKWKNSIDNKGVEQTLTGMVKVEVRAYTGGASVIQEYMYSSGNAVAKATRHATGEFPNLKWSPWAQFSPADIQGQYRLAIRRGGDNEPYMVHVKSNVPSNLAKPNDFFGVSAITMQYGGQTNPNDILSGSVRCANITTQRRGDHSENRLMIQLRDPAGALANELVFYNTHVHASKEFRCLDNVTANDVYIRSDKRMKSHLVQVENALAKVSKLTAYSYNKHKSITDSEVVSREVGLIAQDLQKVLPEAVNEAEDTTLTISNSAVNALLVEAIKELKAEIEELKRGQGK